MAACAHRPEDGCLLVPCFRYEGGRRHECECAAEVRAELPETRVARVPDSARRAQDAQNEPVSASEVTGG